MHHRRVVEIPSLGDPAPFAYSNAVVVGDMVFLAGQCGIDGNYQVAGPDFAAQARQALFRIKQGIEAAGGTIHDLVTMTVFITDIRKGREFTDIRREMFSSDFPASALIGVSSLMPDGAMVEVQAIGVLPPASSREG
ncbi:MAG: RidA family protein [Acidimicrobiia bacterium]